MYTINKVYVHTSFIPFDHRNIVRGVDYTPVIRRYTSPQIDSSSIMEYNNFSNLFVLPILRLYMYICIYVYAFLRVVSRRRYICIYVYIHTCVSIDFSLGTVFVRFIYSLFNGISSNFLELFPRSEINWKEFNVVSFESFYTFFFLFFFFFFV